MENDPTVGKIERRYGKMAKKKGRDPPEPLSEAQPSSSQRSILRIVEPDSARREKEGKDRGGRQMKDRLKRFSVVATQGIELPHNRRRQSLWATVDIHKGLRDEDYVLFAVRDFAIFTIFLITLFIVRFGGVSTSNSYYSSIMRDVFTNTKFETKFGVRKTYFEIRSVTQLWEYITNCFVEIIYEKDFVGNMYWNDYDAVTVLFENVFIGVPQIRVSRVKPDSCQIPSLFEPLYKACYGYYTSSREDHTPFGKKDTSAWFYTGPLKLEGNKHGFIGTYSPGGYRFNFTREQKLTVAYLEKLRDDVWITDGTRLVTIDFTLFSPSANLFCVANFIIEFPCSGGIYPLANFYTMDFLRYSSTLEFIVLTMQLIIIGFVVSYALEEAQEIKILGWKYFNNWWNFLDLVIVIVGVIYVVSFILQLFFVTTSINSIAVHTETDVFVNLDFLVSLQMFYNVNLSILFLLCWIKIIKYATLSRSASLILSTFTKIKTEIITLALMMCTMIFGFSILGTVLFGVRVQQFDTVGSSMATLIGLFVGGLYFYNDCHEGNPIAAPLFFILYIFVVIVLFLNTFVALIVHGYYRAMEDFDDRKSNMYLIDLVYRLWHRILSLLKMKKRANDFLDYIETQKSIIQYDSLVSILRRHGYKGLSLGLLLSKHAIVYGERISKDKMDQVYKDINIRNQLFLEVEEHNKITEEMDKLINKIEYLDQSLGDIVTKTDILVDKFLKR